MAKPAYQIVDELPDEEAEHQSAPPAGLSVLLLALKAISQRAVAAIADLFFLATVFSVFWLWNNTPEPNTLQITSLSIYAGFVLLANFIVRRF